MQSVKKLIPAMQPCHECSAEYAGTHCPICKVENPTFTAMKNIGRKADEEFLLNAVALAGQTC